VKALEYDALAGQGDLPVFLDFKLGSVCNLACVMCTSYSSTRHKRGAAADVYDEGFVRELEAFLPGLREAAFTGGEPFLIRIYYSIWERLAVLNPECVLNVQTNGTVFNAKVEKVLARGRFGLTVSLDSLDARRAARIRVGTKLAEVKRNLRRFGDYCRGKETRLNLCTAVSRLNWMEVPEIVAYADRAGAQIFFCPVYFPLEHAPWAMSVPELKAIRDRFSRARLPGGSELERYNLERFEDLMRSVDYWHRAAQDRPSRSRLGDPASSLRAFGASLEEACRGFGFPKARRESMIAELRERLAALQKGPGDKELIAAYGELSLSMFSPDEIISTLIHEPAERVLRDMRHLPEPAP